MAPSVWTGGNIAPAQHSLSKTDSIRGQSAPLATVSPGKIPLSGTKVSLSASFWHILCPCKHFCIKKCHFWCSSSSKMPLCIKKCHFWCATGTANRTATYTATRTATASQTIPTTPPTPPPATISLFWKIFLFLNKLFLFLRSFLKKSSHLALRK